MLAYREPKVCIIQSLKKVFTYINHDKIVDNQFQNF